MRTDDQLKRGEIVTDGDELLIVEQTPTLLDDSYVVSSYEDSDDLVDDDLSLADADDDAGTGVRAMGGAVGTEHRHAQVDR
jgi:hypothetical protein